MKANFVVRLLGAKGVVLAALVSVSVLGALLAGPAIAGSSKATTVDQVRVAYEDNEQTKSGTFTDIPGAMTSVSVPPNQQGLILARFSGESACSGGDGRHWCSVKILLRKNASGQSFVEMQPDAESDFAFDSTNEGNETGASWESHSMDRSLVVGPGTYTVKAQWATTQSDISFRLDDYSLTVMKATVP